MSEIDPLILEVIADARKLRQEMASAQRLSDIHMGAMERRGVTMARSLNNSFSLAARAAITFAAGFATI